MKDGFVEVEGHFEHVTDNAVLLHVGGENLWLPLSQLGTITYEDGDDPDIYLNTSVEAIEMPLWLARAKGLI